MICSLLPPTLTLFSCYKMYSHSPPCDHWATTSHSTTRTQSSIIVPCVGVQYLPLPGPTISPLQCDHELMPWRLLSVPTAHWRYTGDRERLTVIINNGLYHVTLFWWLILAPASSNTLTTSLWPSRDAIVRGVSWFCYRTEVKWVQVICVPSI